MPCVFEACKTNRQTSSKNAEEGVQFIPFPITDYNNEQLRRLAKKRLYWWCRTCGVDFTVTLLNQLHVCSRHFFKGTCALLWDIYNPDWIPSLRIPLGSGKREFPSCAQSYDGFTKNEQLTEESIANPLLEDTPDPVSMRTELIDELIAYPIGRTYYLLDDEREKGATTPYVVKYLANTMKNCLTRTSGVGKMVFESNAPHYPERMFAGNNTITQVDLNVEPQWETEKTIMKLQNSVLELMNMLDK